MSTQSQIQDKDQKSSQRQVSIPWLLNQKATSKKLTMLTAYDFPTARLLDESGIDMLLVGDSLSTVIYGHIDTLSIDMSTMLRHAEAVSRACRRSFVIGDMPFMSYQVSPHLAVENAGRFLKEARTKAVKLEGGIEFAETIVAIIKAGIPVMGHIGLTPQSLHQQGGYRTHGKTDTERRYLLDSALALEKAGCFSIVLECVEPSLASEISKSIQIPTIGIGSGQNCDGQVLVTQDLVGLTTGHVPSFVSPEANLKEDFMIAIQKYIARTLQ